jgi:hypothetical protein
MSEAYDKQLWYWVQLYGPTISIEIVCLYLDIATDQSDAAGMIPPVRGGCGAPSRSYCAGYGIYLHQVQTRIFDAEKTSYTLKGLWHAEFCTSGLTKHRKVLFTPTVSGATFYFLNAILMCGKHVANHRRHLDNAAFSYVYQTWRDLDSLFTLPIILECRHRCALWALITTISPQSPWTHLFQWWRHGMTTGSAVSPKAFFPIWTFSS